jgi:hypothetical protein
MSKKAKKSRRGRYLCTMSAADLITFDPDLARFDAERQAAGFKLKQTIRPYLAVSGLVTLRFVWRKRADGVTQVYEQIFRSPLSDLQTS